MRIRPATMADAPQVIGLGQKFLDESQYGRLFPGTTVEALATVFGQVLAIGQIFVAEDSLVREVEQFAGGVKVWQRPIVGMIALIAAPHPLTGKSYGDELAWFVEPAHRGGTVGYKLLCAAEDWARQKGLSVLKMVAPHDSAAGKVYARRGYVPVETAWIKRFDE